MIFSDILRDITALVESHGIPEQEGYPDSENSGMIFPQALEAMQSAYMKGGNGHPSITHLKGWEAYETLYKSTLILAAAMNCKPDEIAFTDSGTEANKVIRGDVKTKIGLFTTHMIGTSLYYEIPAKELGKDLMVSLQLAKTNLGDGFGGERIGTRVVRWERRANRILLRNVSYDIVADPSQPIAEAVDNSNSTRCSRSSRSRPTAPTRSRSST